MDNQTLKHIEKLVTGVKKDIKDIKKELKKHVTKADLINLGKRVDIIEENLQISSN